MQKLYPLFSPKLHLRVCKRKMLITVSQSPKVISQKPKDNSLLDNKKRQKRQKKTPADPYISETSKRFIFVLEKKLKRLID